MLPTRGLGLQARSARRSLYGRHCLAASWSDSLQSMRSSALDAATDQMGATAYALGGSGYDEAFSHTDVPRRHYRELLARLSGTDLAALRARVQRDLAANHVAFSTGEDRTEQFVVDPIPRLIPRAEWERLASGLRQRVMALDRFVADVHGAQAIIREGAVPEAAVLSARHFDPLARLIPVSPTGARIGIAGLDLVRDAAGRVLVLEDNVRTPSGMAYASAARSAVLSALEWAQAPAVASLESAFSALGATLRAAAHDPSPDTLVVLLSDGPCNSAWWEHEWLADRLALPLVTMDDLEVRGQRLWLSRHRARARPIDVVYRRTDEDRLTDGRGRLTDIGQLLWEPLRAGRLACVNAFGTGVADDKLLFAYVPAMIRFYLGEEPLLESVTTYDLGDPRQLAAALPRVGELVIKPRTGHGGHGVFVGPHASDTDRHRMADLIRSRPHQLVAQEMISLSTHPSIIDGCLEPRHVDLRPYVFLSSQTPSVFPGGLTRVALDQGDTVVNSSQSGGGKDTWVLA